MYENKSYTVFNVIAYIAFYSFSIFGMHNIQAQNFPSSIKNNNCITCHASNKKLLGPSWQDISSKYKKEGNKEEILSNSILNGANNKWGSIPMPANPQLKAEEVNGITQWILQQ
jgi:cytochrome c